MNDSDWSQKPARAYDSTGRKKSAEEKHDTILEAARTLFRQRGFEATTIDAIAKEAGVSAPTVYAAFLSKRGVLAAILKKARFNSEYDAAISRVSAETDVFERLRIVAAIARSIYQGERQEMDFLQGSGIVDPELAAVQNEQEVQRRERQKHNIDLLIQKAALKEGLDAQTAQDILWVLTSRDLYHLLVVERAWEPEKYEAWLAGTLIEALTDKKS